MAANTALKGTTEINWARQLRGEQQKLRPRESSAANFRLAPREPEQIIPPNQQNFQPLPMRLPGDEPTMKSEPESWRANDTTDFTENNDNEIELSEEDIYDVEDQEAYQTRQLAFHRLQAQRTQATINASQQKNQAQQNKGAGSANQSLLNKISGDITKTIVNAPEVELFLRLTAGDDRNKSISGKIGFVLRIVVLCVGGYRFIDGADKIMGFMFGGGNLATKVQSLSSAKQSGEIEVSPEEQHKGERKTDTLLTIIFFLNLAMQIFITLLPIIIILAIAFGIASAVS